MDKECKRIQMCTDVYPDDSMVLIVDDRANVWLPTENLIKVWQTT